jgi:hypothetical protein
MIRKRKIIESQGLTLENIQRALKIHLEKRARAEAKNREEALRQDRGESFFNDRD